MTKRLWLALFVAGATLAPTVRAAQPTLEIDPCGLATFPDEAKRKEYRQWEMKLGYSPRHNAALRELKKLGDSFLARKVGKELFALWNDTNRQIQKAVRANELAEVQAVLMDRCLDRLKQSPATETDRVRADIENFRTLLALPDDELEATLKARLKAMLEAFGTPDAANQTLRINLGLPVPH